MQITWYGHSCFLLESAAGTRILTDPCDPSVGYDIHDVQCDAVTVSHSHYDHSYVAAAAGTPAIIDSPGEHRVHDAVVTGFLSWHDEAQGQKRGANILFLMEIDGIRVLHAGDLGHDLPQSTVDSIGCMDVLLCPVGGTYTIDAMGAKRVAEALKPKIFIPMHYATPVTTLAISGLDPFLASVDGAVGVHRLNSPACTVTGETLTENRILILDYLK